AGAKGKTPWDAPQNCARFDWRAFRFSDADLDREFSGRVTGLGAILGHDALTPEEVSNNLEDVDLDCAAARALADDFLPATGCEWGRVSTRRAHRVYIGDEALPTIRFKDCDADKTTLLELRGTGGQTAVPPSFHVDSDEVVAFDANGDPAPVKTTNL